MLESLPDVGISQNARVVVEAFENRGRDTISFILKETEPERPHQRKYVDDEQRRDRRRNEQGSAPLRTQHPAEETSDIAGRLGSRFVSARIGICDCRRHGDRMLCERRKPTALASLAPVGFCMKPPEWVERLHVSIRALLDAPGFTQKL